MLRLLRQYFLSDSRHTNFWVWYALRLTSIQTNDYKNFKESNSKIKNPCRLTSETLDIEINICFWSQHMLVGKGGFFSTGEALRNIVKIFSIKWQASTSTFNVKTLFFCEDTNVPNRKS